MDDKEFDKKVSDSPELQKLKEAERALAEALADIMILTHNITGRPQHAVCMKPLFAWASNMDWRFGMMRNILRLWKEKQKFVCAACELNNLPRCVTPEECAERLNDESALNMTTLKGLMAAAAAIYMQDLAQRLASSVTTTEEPNLN
jgi:galactose-1-phosphate uridylyltransferase